MVRGLANSRLLELCGSMMIEHSLKEIFIGIDFIPTELYSADEMYLHGTGAQVAPVIEVDRRLKGDRMVGPIPSKLQEIFFDVVRGKNPTYRDQWYTPFYAEVPVHS